MSYKILRWKGGMCGDLLIKLITASNKEIKTNTSVDNLVHNGKIWVEPLNKSSNINLLAWNPLHLVGAQINFKKLQEELSILRKTKDFWILKSHCYKMFAEDEDIIDIVIDEYSLSYVMIANITKTNTVREDYNKLAKIIKDNEVARKYALYNVGQDSLGTRKKIKKNLIFVSDIIGGDWQTLKKKLEIYNIFLKKNTEQIYDKWKKLNIDYFPSKQYLDYIKQKNYNFDDASLSLHERYALLLLSNEKFQLLK